MAINFPLSPTLNEIYSYNGLSWQWNGSYWQSFPPSSGATGVVTSIIASTGLSANTTTGNVTLVVTGSTGGGTFTGGTVTGATSFTGGLTANTISATTYYNVSSNFQYEIHVSQVDGNDTTGNGDLLNPVATITKALTLLIGSRKTILIHPGTYTENVTVANTNTIIATSELTGANTLLSGTLTIGTLGSGSRISGLKMTNLVISGTAQAYISNCTVDTQVTKSSSGYVEIINSEMQCISGIQISGSGTTIINGNKNVGISVSNASAQVIVKGCNSVVTPSASAGNLAIVDCIVTALGGNAITITNSATTLTLLNSQVLVQAGNNVAPISVAGIYSIINTIYNKPGSTFTGTSTNSIDYFQSINADKFITQGGTSLQYVMGDGSLSNGFTGGTVSGATNFTGGLTATTISATTITGNDLIVNNSFEFIAPQYYNEIRAYYNLVSFDANSLVTPLNNEGFGGDEDLVSGAVFLTLSNDSDSRAIEILYTLRSTNDDNFRSGKIIANWNKTYTNFYQTEYGPNYDLTTMTFIDPPRVFYGGSGTIIRVKIDFDDVTDPANLLTARFKYTLI
jgi:hypothetical protein